MIEKKIDPEETKLIEEMQELKKTLPKSASMPKLSLVSGEFEEHEFDNNEVEEYMTKLDTFFGQFKALKSKM